MKRNTKTESITVNSTRLQYRLCAAATALMLLLSAGCAREASYDIDESSEDRQEYAEWKYDGGAYTSAKEKSEIVTAHADASGRIKEIDDVVSLKGIRSTEETASDAAIRDVTDLSEISNRDGDESYELKDSYVYFENLGSDISYEGKGSSEIPVQLNIKYYMDGEEMSPDKIKGRKGHAKVEFSFENNANCNPVIGGAERDLKVPFSVISIVTMEDDSMRNLKLEDCKETSFNSENIIMAFTMPGMKHNIETLSFDAADLDIAESFSFEFDTDAFAIGFSTNLISSNLMDEETDFTELEDLRSSLSDLDSAGKKLSDAGCEVTDGMSAFRKYLSAYTDGASDLDTGISALADGIKQINDNSKLITDGASELSEGLAAYDAAFAELRPRLEAMLALEPDNEELQALIQWYEAMAEQSAKLKEGSTDYAAGADAYAKGIAEAYDGAEKLKEGSAQYVSQGSELLKGYDSVSDGISEYVNAVCKFYKEGIAKLVNEGGSKISDIENLIRMIETAGDEYDTYSGLEEGQSGSVTFLIETEEVKAD